MDNIRKEEGFQGQRLLVVPDSVRTLSRSHLLASQLYVTDIGYFPKAKHHYRARPEGCSTTIIMACISGSGWIETSTTGKIHIQSGQFAMIPAGVPHQYGAEEIDPWSIYWIHIQGEHVELFLGKSPSLLALPSKAMNRWTQLFEECWTSLQVGWTATALVVTSQTVRYMLAILYQEIERSSISSKHNEHIEKTIVYFNNHMNEQLSLDELTTYVNVSKPHLITLFKRITGHPPLDYFLRMKIRQACVHLDFTDWTVKEIAMQVGFHDPYYFSRQFRKVMGQSPAKYRDAVKG